MTTGVSNWTRCTVLQFLFHSLGMSLYMLNMIMSTALSWPVALKHAFTIRKYLYIITANPWQNKMRSSSNKLCRLLSEANWFENQRTHRDVTGLRDLA